MPSHRTPVSQAIKMLSNLESWLDEASEYAESREFDFDVLLQSRLYPDMFPLIRQVQAAADAAKFIGARLAGIDPPVNEDTETTLDELRARVASTIAFLADVDEEAFDKGRDSELTPAFLHGGSITGADYLNEFALPNFYFHISMAYAILRHNGVKLGKRAFIGSMNVKMPQ